MDSDDKPLILTELKSKHSGHEVIIPVCIPMINHKTGYSLKAYFFLGNIPKAVFAAIKRDPWNKEDAAIISDYYGPKWKQYLTASNLKLNKLNEKFSIFGGSEDLPINFKEFDFDANEGPTKLIKKSDNKINFNYSFSPEAVYSTLSIDSEDTIMIIKKKLQFVSGVQIFRQHLFYYFNNEGPLVPYKITTNDIPIEVNWQQLNKNTLLCGVGIDLLLMDTKTCLIRAEDEFIKFSEVKGVFPNLYFIDLYSVIKPLSAKDRPDDNLADILNDKQQFAILYYGAIVKFWPFLNQDAAITALTNPNIVVEKYPLLAKQEEFEKLAIFTESAIKNNTICPVTVTKATIINTPFGKNCVINLQNIFIWLKPDSKLIAIKVFNDLGIFTKRDPSSFGLNIRYVVDKLLEYYLAKNTLLFLIRNRENSVITVKLSIDGQYITTTNWLEDDFIQFEDISSDASRHTNKLITDINLMGAAAFPLGGNLTTNDRLTNISLGLITCTIFWPYLLSNSAFKKVKELFRDYELIGVIETYGIQQLNSYMFNFKHNIVFYNSRLLDGMWEKLNNTNQYVYLLEDLAHSRWNSVFTGRQVKIIHRITDLKIEIHGANNLQEFNYIKGFILSLLEDNKQILTKIHDKSAEQNQLRKLQEQDPNLYDLKKYDPNSEVYARLCQSDRQPRIYLKGEPLDANAVKYWNFTTNRPAWYICNNKKYPYLGFQSVGHPKGWCLPCCKRGIANKQDNECLTKHKYDDEDLHSKHVLLYGKPLFDYRISHCPKEIEDGIFLNTMRENTTYDRRSDDVYQFKLIGTIQSSPAIESAGYMYSIAHALGEENKIIAEIANYARDLEDYNTLGDGIASVFKSSNELADCIMDSFIKGAQLTKFSVGGPAEDWEYIIRDIIFDLYDLCVVHFYDFNNEVKMHIDYETEKVVCLFSNDQGTYLIGAMKPSFYLRTLRLEKVKVSRRWFTKDTTHEIKDTVHKTIFNFLKIRESDMNIYSFPEGKYQIQTALLNMHNKCYGAIVKKGDLKLYCPLNISSYPDIEITYETRDFINDKEDIMELINYLKLKLTLYLVRIVSETEFYEIGAEAGGLYFYYKDIKLANLPEKYINIPYDPILIDSLIAAAARNDIKEPEKLELNYINRLYSLFLIEFATIIKNNKNDKLRKELKKTIQEFDIHNSLALKEKIANMNLSIGDMNIIRDIIRESYGNKEKALSIIDDTKFEFDLQLIGEIKKNNALLKPIMQKVCEIGPIEKLDLAEIVVSCSETTMLPRPHCKNAKLLISQELFDTYCELLLNDINDPGKHILLLAATN
jgi:hypothetical protein